MAETDQIEALLAQHQDRMDEGYTEREKASAPPAGKFVVSLAFVGEYLNQHKETGQEYVSLPTYFRITDVERLTDPDFTEDEVLEGDGLLVYGPSLSTAPGQEWSRDGFYSLAALIAGESVTALAVARNIIQAAVKEAESSGIPYRFIADGKRNKKGYVNLRILKRFKGA